MGQHIWEDDNETPETEPAPVEDVSSGDAGNDDEEPVYAPTEG